MLTIRQKTTSIWQPTPLLAAYLGMLLLTAGCGGGIDSASSGGDSATSASSATSGSSGNGTSSSPGTGTATLSWDRPTENTNGTALSDLAGYYIHYGTSADDLTQTITVQGADVSEYEITNLAPGTYYFAVAAYASDGTESAPSNFASKSI
jgi:hypothetical protein